MVTSLLGRPIVAKATVRRPLQRVAVNAVFRVKVLLANPEGGEVAADNRAR
ncbi:MAG TPA: hypothetical protein VGX03_38800 [Candidatus Binatia bacterium]|jgi:hypothetical protein|nr:hypothetical protein [Candidatus Binatia bacterium]